MNKTGTTNKDMEATKKTSKIIIIVAALAAILVIGIVMVRFGAGVAGPANAPGDLKIPKSEISETAKFYPYQIGKTRMEVLAVKASDGTVRTAFNTCQVCYDSGRGYYVQEGKELVCQNCGNRFPLDQIEVIRGGCNPVPITSEYKTEDDAYIVISQAFLKENKALFESWRR